MGAVLYLRVSSQKQKRQELSLAAQRRALRQWARKEGVPVLAEYVDEAQSGRTDRRPAFQSLVADVQAPGRAWDCVLVWRFDRFARNQEEAGVYRALLRRQQVRLLSITEPVDEGPAGRLTEGVLDALNEFQSAKLAQDTARGQAENARRGWWNGGPPPTGYCLESVPDGSRTRTRLAVDPDTAPVVQRMFELCLLGESLRGIARRLTADGVRLPSGRAPYAALVQTILLNPVYTGTRVWSRTRSPSTGLAEPVEIEGAHPALIDQATFDRAQAALASRRPANVPPRLNSSRYLLTGRAVCGLCGHRMQGRHRLDRPGQTEAWHYYCAGRAEGVGCSLPYVRLEALEGAVLEVLSQALIDDVFVGRIVDRVRQGEAHKGAEPGQDFQRRRTDLQKRRANLLAAVEEGALPLSQVKDRLEDLQRAEAALEPPTRRRALLPVDEAEVRAYLQRLPGLLELGSPAQRRQLVHSVVQAVRVEPDAAEVDLGVEGTTETRRVVFA